MWTYFVNRKILGVDKLSRDMYFKNSVLYDSWKQSYYPGVT